MKKNHFLLFVFSICFSIHTFGQIYNPADTLRSHRNARSLGILLSADLAYNQEDKLFNPYIARKLNACLSFSNKKQDFLFFAGGGLKIIRFSIYSPLFTSQFIDELNQSYHPISGNWSDSTNASDVYSMAQKKEGFHLSGYHAQYFCAGFIFTRYKIRPSITYYLGREVFQLSIPPTIVAQNAFVIGQWLPMPAVFQEVKIGLDVLAIFSRHRLPFSLDLNAGYKWMNYKDISFLHTPLSAYTNDQITGKYNLSQKIIIGINFRYWTNWTF